MLILLKRVFSNKITLYLISRYFTYFIQFLTSIFIAVKLGTSYFGIWSFLLLLVSYFHVSNFGIANAANIFMVQYKDDEQGEKDIVLASFVALIGTFCLVIFAALYYYFFGIPFFEKYHVENLFYFVCLIALLDYANVLMMNIYRVKNRLFEIAFFQSVIPLLVFVSVVFVSGKTLMYVLIGAYVWGNLLSFLLFVFKGKIPTGGKFYWHNVAAVLKKGWLLFLYNLSFYLIIISIRTIVSIFYTVEEFAFFSFSYTLANSVLLFLQAMTFIVFPKVIDRLHTRAKEEVLSLFEEMRTSYVTFAFGLVFFALMLFPFFLKLIPQYSDALLTLQLISLTVVLYANSFGFGSYLMAKNREKELAVIAISSLLLNVALALFIVVVLKAPYTYVIFSTMCSYTLFSLLCAYKSRVLLGDQAAHFKMWNDIFPCKLLIPYLCAIIAVILNNILLSALPFILFVLLNRSAIIAIVEKIKLILKKPDIINL